MDYEPSPSFRNTGNSLRASRAGWRVQAGEVFKRPAGGAWDCGDLRARLGLKAFTQSWQSSFPAARSRSFPPQRARRNLCRALTLAVLLLAGPALYGQLETVEGGPAPQMVWQSLGHIEGHLATEFSDFGAFAPDNSVLAAVNEDKIVLFGLKDGAMQKALKVHLTDISDISIQSASFVDPTRLLVLATGMIKPKGHEPRPSPLLTFLWDSATDSLSGKLNAVTLQGAGRPRYFPEIKYLGIAKGNAIDLWNPLTGRGGRIEIPSLTQTALVYALSPDGHWLIIGRLPSSGTRNPIVVQLSTKQFVDSLRGHEAGVLSVAFSRDNKKVVTASEDGNVRVFSAPDWKLLLTLTGHVGPVHWADFSVDGQYIVSAGEDKTVRVWRAEDGKPLQTLQDLQAPALGAAFSPNGEYLAATSESGVQIWRRVATN
jgi:WD domain, G-beta repeat